MIKFEKRFLYTFADVEEAKKLIGKKGLFFDNYIDDDELRKKTMETLQTILPFYVTSGGFIFKSEQGENYHFFYYDPYLKFKRAYFLEGKTLQRKLSDGEWVDEICPCWNIHLEYRIKPETKTHLTNRELSMWLAKGNGQARPIGTNKTTMSFTYLDRVENEPCVFEIRKWSDTEWHEATREYIEGELNEI